MKKIFKIGMIFILCLSFMGCSSNEDKEGKENKEVSKEEVIEERYEVQYKPTITDNNGEWSFNLGIGGHFEVRFDRALIQSVIFVPFAPENPNDKTYYVIYDDKTPDLELDDTNDPNNNIRSFFKETDITYNDFLEWMANYINENTTEIVRPVWEGKSHDEVLSILTANGYTITIGEDNGLSRTISGTEFTIRKDGVIEGLHVSGRTIYTEDNMHIIQAAIYDVYTPGYVHDISYELQYDEDHEEGEKISYFVSTEVPDGTSIDPAYCKWDMVKETEMGTEDRCDAPYLLQIREYRAEVEDWLASMGLTKEDLLGFLEVHFREIGKGKVDIIEQ